jgi:GTP-binding protein LepA
VSRQCANILVPQEHLGNVITLCNEKRGVQHRYVWFPFGSQVQVTYDPPMNEVVLDFLTVQSTSRGCSRWITILLTGTANLVKLDVLINAESRRLGVNQHRDNAHL